MKIMDILSEDCVVVGLEAEDRDGVIKELLDVLVNAGKIKKEDENAIFNVLIDREELGSTAIGNGIAIPHAKTDKVSELVSAFGVSKKGVDFRALDGEKVYLFFLLIAPKDSPGPHLKALARITRLLKDKNFRAMLMEVKDKQEAVKLIEEEDNRFS